MLHGSIPWRSRKGASAIARIREREPDDGGIEGLAQQRVGVEAGANGEERPPPPAA